MKRLKKWIVLLMILVLAIPAISMAAVGTVVQTHNLIGKDIATLTIVCIGGTDAQAGTVPNTAISITNTNKLLGWYLYSVTAFRTVGGTAPDEASVFIKDATGLYLLGSVDDGTTAYNGSKLIHASGTRSCFPNKYILGTGEHYNYFPEVNNVWTLIVADQATASADFTIVLTFIK